MTFVYAIRNEQINSCPESTIFARSMRACVLRGAGEYRYGHAVLQPIFNMVHDLLCHEYYEVIYAICNALQVPLSAVRLLRTFIDVTYEW